MRRFPANNDGSPLVTLAAGAEKEGSCAVMPCGQLAVFSLDSPGKSEKRRDSVFFASVSTSVARAVDNLMSFSPVVESNESGTCCLISISFCLSVCLLFCGKLKTETFISDQQISSFLSLTVI